MTFTLIYPTVGRGSFATNAQLGGTLGVKRVGPGPYYAAPASGLFKDMPGSRGALAVRNGTACDVNDYAVHRAVAALQRQVGISKIDGIFGSDTDTAAKSYQNWNGLIADGILGPKTCRDMFEPQVVAAAMKVGDGHADAIRRIAVGTITIESGWDLGAVGVTTPHDLGLAQINGPAHPTMSAAARLDPAAAITWMVGFIEGNLRYMNWDVAAAVISYNIGRGGATSWVRAGKPQYYYGVDTTAYIEKILKAGMQ